MESLCASSDFLLLSNGTTGADDSPTLTPPPLVYLSCPVLLSTLYCGAVHCAPTCLGNKTSTAARRHFYQSVNQVDKSDSRGCGLGENTRRLEENVLPVVTHKERAVCLSGQRTEFLKARLGGREKRVNQ